MPLLVHIIARCNDGGPARVVAALAGGLQTARWRVVILHGACPPDEVDLAPQLSAAGLDLRLVEGLAPEAPLRQDLAALGRLHRMLRELAPDLVHTHTAKAGMLGRLAAARLGLAVLHSYHGHVLEGYFSAARSRCYRGLERLLSLRGRLHALTPRLVEELRDRHRIGRRPRWHCLPVPVAPVVPRAAGWHGQLLPELPVVGWLARAAPVKDPLLWLRTLRALRERLPVQGLVCGEGALLEAMRALARRWALPVCFVGQVPAGEALAAMDLLLLSSRNEGQPLALVEAAGTGLPVVATAVGGCPDLARLGLARVAPRDPQALAEACAEVLRAPPDPAALREAAVRLAPGALLPAWRRCYHRLAGGQDRRR